MALRTDPNRSVDQATIISFDPDARQVTADRVPVAAARSPGMRVAGWPTNSRDDLDSVLRLEPALGRTGAP